MRKILHVCVLFILFSLNFGLYYEENFARLCTFYAYVHFVIVLFSFFVPLGTLGLIIVRQCRNAVVW